MKNVRAPELLDKLYRDLRDRRLLLPAALLVVALIAVPVLLKSNSSGATAPASAATSSRGGDATAVQPAVTTRQVGVTEYRRRLDHLSSKNPFHQQYLAPTDRQTLHATGTGGGGSDASSTGTATDTSTSTGSSTVTTPSTSTDTPTVSPSPPVSTSPSPPSAGHGPKPDFHLYTFRVSLKIGEPGKLDARPEVSSLALLPSKGKPIVSFLESNAKQALFLVSSDVDSVKGDGRCVPRKSACQYMVMRPGDKANLHYGPNGKRYNLVLVDIHAVEIDHKPPTGVSRKGDAKLKLPLLGSG